MVRRTTAIRDAEILHLYQDGVHVKRIAQVLHLKNKWRVYRALHRAIRRADVCSDCPLNPTNATKCQK